MNNINLLMNCKALACKPSDVASRFSAKVGGRLVQTFRRSKLTLEPRTKRCCGQYNWGEDSYASLEAKHGRGGLEILIKRLDEEETNLSDEFIQPKDLSLFEGAPREILAGVKEMLQRSGDLFWEFSLCLSPDFSRIKFFSFALGHATEPEKPLTFENLSVPSFIDSYYSLPGARILVDGFFRQNIEMLTSTRRSSLPSLTPLQGKLFKQFLLGENT